MTDALYDDPANRAATLAVLTDALRSDDVWAGYSYRDRLGRTVDGQTARRTVASRFLFARKLVRDGRLNDWSER